MKTKRQQILDYFHHQNKFESSLKTNKSDLYSYFMHIMKRIPKFRKKVEIFCNDNLYKLYRLSKIDRKKFVEFGYFIKYPMREVQLKILGFEPDDGYARFETVYKIKFGDVPRRKNCNKKLKFQMYSDNKSKTFCSDRCQKEYVYQTYQNRCHAKYYYT